MPDLDLGNRNDYKIIMEVAKGVELQSQANNKSNNSSGKPVPIGSNIGKQPAINFKEQGRVDNQDSNSLITPYTAIDPNANQPQTLSTPLPKKTNSDNITPDQSGKIKEFGKLPGFTIGPKIDPVLSTPDQSHLTRLGMILTLDKGQIREIIGTRVDTGAVDIGSRSREEYIEWATNDLYKKIGPYQREGTLGGAWDNKIVGFGQKTGTVGHVETAESLAVELAKNPNVKAVFLNQGINKIAGLLGKTNFRPDVSWITEDGKIHVIEVKSDSDKEPNLEIRAEKTIGRLKEPLQGTQKVVDPEEIIDKK